MKRNVIFHPFIIALYPAVILYLRNFEYVLLSDALLSFLVIVAALIFVWAITAWIVKPLNKAALITSSFFLLFFTFGHVLAALINYLLAYFNVNAQSIGFLQTRSASLILLAIFGGIFVAIFTLTISSKSDFRIFTQFMNVVSVTLLLLAGYKALGVMNPNGHDRQKQQILTKERLVVDNLSRLAHSDAPQTPDIYYIILDGYARSDIMESVVGFDNSDFIEFLHDEGFYVADQSHSNYNFTYASITSSLNFDYLEAITGKISSDDNGISLVLNLLSSNRVMRFLDTQGYTTMVFPSGYYPVERIKGDLFMRPPARFNSFQDEIINATPLKLVFSQNQYELYRQRILYQFQNIPQIDSDSYPKFIFAHIIAPHRPYVFESDGSPHNPEQDFKQNEEDTLTTQLDRPTDIQGYRNQAIFVTAQTTILVENLLKLEPQPIIILQSDHGPGIDYNSSDIDATNITERYSILNAYYFPDGNYTNLYPSVTPVNSFRIILDQYFSTQLGVLEDQSYWAQMNFPVDALNVTERYDIP